MEKAEERLLKIMQRKFGYSDEELDVFKSNPRNLDLIKRSKEFNKTQFILEVVESKGCNSNHKVGEKFYFDFAGNILTGLCPPKICGYSLNSAMMMIFTANEMLYAGVDPNEIRFKRASCFDVGIECGGWGRIVLELRIEKQ
ncbi:hypothetical protein [Desulfopila inferna]|uniref:hypothetical protein n=1 Tax=Desulfopila inferna TaxID=468528 RepID=UPI001966B051|nr:hypothetical protein [Desulfopila inferna]MBM9604602.1 hypothetical protein [Desulfopila inferna]